MTEEKLYTVAQKGGDDPEIAVASSGALDRDQERIDPNGWELDNYEKAGKPIQLDHNPGTLATVGNAAWVKVSNEKLLFKPIFHDKTPESRSVKALWDAGIVRTFSVGFIPKESIEGTKDVDDFRRKYIRQELLEISITPVPSNPEARRAVAKAFSDGIIKDVSLAEYLAPGSTTEEEVIEEEVIEEPKEEVVEEEPENEEEPEDESIEIDETIEIPETEEIEIDPKQIDELIKKQAEKTAEIVIATRKGKVIEI